MNEEEEGAARRAEAAARLAELMEKLKDAEARLDRMVAASRTLREKLQEVRVEQESGSPNGT